MKMYYVALVPPPPVSTDVLQWKKWMEEEFDSVVAQRSPAHITLVPPFWMKEEMEPDLIAGLSGFAASRDSFPVQLNGFGHFRSRVIYVHVEPGSELFSLRSALFDSLGSFPLPPLEPGFTPHITIATRDLKKADFPAAWRRFSEMNYRQEWLCRSVSLLRHNKKNWDVIATSQFR